MPLAIVLDEEDARWLAQVVLSTHWPGTDSERVTRLKSALAHALEVDDADDVDEPDYQSLPQGNIGADAFVGT
jgi:hypothetical protein